MRPLTKAVLGLPDIEALLGYLRGEGNGPGEVASAEPLIEMLLERSNAGGDAELIRKYQEATPNEDGETEVDDNAAVSMGGDRGAYVQTWTWVSDEDAGIPVEEEGRE